MVYHDELVRVFADVEDTPENRQYFLELKGRLKGRFEHIEIWLTSHPLDLL